MKQGKGKILLIEDNVDLNDANSQALELQGYEVYVALTLEKGEQILSWIEPDVILLDVMLPDGSGFDFCEEVRKITTAHIIFLTAKASHEDMVRGFTNGGDAYITKPFDSEEMLVKVAAAIRRRKLDKSYLITKGSLTLDVMAAQAFTQGESLNLTSTEFSLLLLFVKNEGLALSATSIYETVWKMPAINYKRALHSVISKLRYKIENVEYDIVSKHGYGYIFEKS